MITKNNVIVNSLLAIGMTTLSVTPIQAEEFGYGGYEGFRGFVNRTPQITLKSSVTAQPKVKYDGQPKLVSKSSATFQINSPVTIVETTYFGLTSSEADPFVVGDPVKITNVWARELNNLVAALSPIVPANSLTGFDPINPEIVPLGDEVFVGITGTLYTSILTPITIANLPTVLPTDLSGSGYDLSAFAAGDPDSIVYVSQITASSFDFISVPEPSTFLGLLTFGLLGSGLTYKRKIQNSLNDSDKRKPTNV